jgi:hypothetical protein
VLPARFENNMRIAAMIGIGDTATTMANGKISPIAVPIDTPFGSPVTGGNVGPVLRLVTVTARTTPGEHPHRVSETGGRRVWAGVQEATGASKSCVCRTRSRADRLHSQANGNRGGHDAGCRVQGVTMLNEGSPLSSTPNGDGRTFASRRYRCRG